MPHNLLHDRVAIVTGAGQGLGRAVALEYAAEGAAVALLEVNGDSLAETAASIEEQGGQCKSFALDITDYDAYADVVAAVIHWKGKIDILVNNAAIAVYGTILDDSLENTGANRSLSIWKPSIWARNWSCRPWLKRVTVALSV